MKYKVEEIYTPKDVANIKHHFEPTNVEFESDSENLFELAIQARTACHPPEVRDAELISRIHQRLGYDGVREQLEGQEISCFSFVLFGGHGEWAMTVKAELT